MKPDVLEECITHLGENLTERQMRAIHEYCALLRSWGQRRNLVSRRDLPHLESLHVCDSLSALPLIPMTLAGSVLDVGSGAGLPGIPIAIVRPQLELVLVEARLGRAEFLEVVLGRLCLGRVRVVRARAEELGEEHRGAYELVLARAVKKLRQLLPLAARFLSSAGRLIVFKGPSYQRELNDLPGSGSLRLEAVREVRLPEKHGRRYLLSFVGG